MPKTATKGHKSAPNKPLFSRLKKSVRGRPRDPDLRERNLDVELHEGTIAERLRLEPAWIQPETLGPNHGDVARCVAVTETAEDWGLRRDTVRKSAERAASKHPEARIEMTDLEPAMMGKTQLGAASTVGYHGAQTFNESPAEPCLCNDEVGPHLHCQGCEVAFGSPLGLPFRDSRRVRNQISAANEYQYSRPVEGCSRSCAERVWEIRGKYVEGVRFPPREPAHKKH